MSLESNNLKISIVTPVFNQASFIEQTILSVINQNYSNFEYIVVDGGSTDGTIDIIKKYEDQITCWFSEPDNGMYDALNKGFINTTGDIMCWINSDDMLLPNALFQMNRIMMDLPTVRWVQGLNSFIDLNGYLTHVNKPKHFSLIKFLNKDYKYIQQESTFWRRSLWEESAAYLDQKLKLAGDFELWFRFFQYSKLYSCNVPIGAWRKRDGQLSGVQMDNYLKEVHETIENYQISNSEQFILNKINKISSYQRWVNKLKILNKNYLEKKIRNLEQRHLTEIVFSYENQKFEIR